MRRFANEQCASREPFPAKPLRWHKLVPVGTGIAEVSVDLAPLPLTLVHQGRWATGGQLNSGHLLLQDDQTDRYISACWTSAAQLQPNGIVLSHERSFAVIVRGNERAEPSWLFQRPQNALISLEVKVIADSCRRYKD